jgi:hypothetical protein
MIYRLIAWLGALQAFIDRRTCNAIIRFACSTGGYYVASPVVRAGNIRPAWLTDMILATKEKKAKGNKKAAVKFVNCPGMHDYAMEGYLIVAHTDIHIKANTLDAQVKTPNIAEQHLLPSKMDMEVVTGMAPFRDGVSQHVWKIPVPWSIFMPPGHSMHLLPALMHFPFAKEIWIYPGTVDYGNGFPTANCIISVITPCDIVIPAGTPLLQCLPFKNVAYHGISGKATELEIDQARYSFASRLKAAYRRTFHTKKVYTCEEQ